MRTAARFSAFVLSLIVFNPARASDWTQWRGDGRDGVAHDSPRLIDALPSEGLAPLWRTEPIPSGTDGGWSSPVVSGGKLYVYTHMRARTSQDKLPARQYPYLADDKRGHLSPAEFAEYEIKRREEDRSLSNFFEYREVLHCFDALTGKPLWRDTKPSVYTRFLHSGTPAVVDGKVYVLGAARTARCFDAATGERLWETRLPGEFLDEYMMSSFAVADGVAAVLAGHLFGLDSQSGSILWEGDAQKTKGTHSSPAVWLSHGHAKFIVNVTGDTTICVEPKTGEENWRIKSYARQSTPVVVGDKLVTLGDQRRGGLRCFDMTPAAANERWAYQRIADKGSSPVVVGDYVYAQGEKRMCCVNLETGDEAWNTLVDLATPQYTSLVAGDNKVIYAHDGVMMFAADPKEFRPLFAAKLDKTGLMASEEEFRRRLKLSELERTDGGLEKSMRLFQKEITNQGPLPCSSPALVDGRLYLRLRQGIACYNLAAR